MVRGAQEEGGIEEDAEKGGRREREGRGRILWGKGNEKRKYG